jgi:hypothetical protein
MRKEECHRPPNRPPRAMRASKPRASIACRLAHAHDEITGAHDGRGESRAFLPKLSEQSPGARGLAATSYNGSAQPWAGLPRAAATPGSGGRLHPADPAAARSAHAGACACSAHRAAPCWRQVGHGSEGPVLAGPSRWVCADQAHGGHWHAVRGGRLPSLRRGLRDCVESRRASRRGAGPEVAPWAAGRARSVRAGAAGASRSRLGQRSRADLGARA